MVASIIAGRCQQKTSQAGHDRSSEEIHYFFLVMRTRCMNQGMQRAVLENGTLKVALVYEELLSGKTV